MSCVIQQPVLGFSFIKSPVLSVKTQLYVRGGNSLNSCIFCLENTVGFLKNQRDSMFSQNQEKFLRLEGSKHRGSVLPLASLHVFGYAVLLLSQPREKSCSV